MYKTIFINTTPDASIPSYGNATQHNILDAIKNFDVALLFNPNDIDAKARKDKLCHHWGPNAPTDAANGFNGGVITLAQLNSQQTQAKNIYRNCTC